MIDEAIAALKAAESDEERRWCVVVFDISGTEEVEQAIYTNVRPSTLADQLDSLALFLRENADRLRRVHGNRN